MLTTLNAVPVCPAPALPPAGNLLPPADCLMCKDTQVMRETDERDGEVAGTIYSNWHSWSKDNKHFLYTVWSPYPKPSGPHLAEFNPETMALTNKRPLPLWQGNAGVVQDGLAWSYLDSEKLYTVAEGKKLVSFSLTTNQYSLIADFSTFNVPGLDLQTNGITSMHMDAHDEVFVFRLQLAGSGIEVGYFAYQRSTNKLLFYKANSDVHHILVDRSGRYCIAKYSTQIPDKPNATVVDHQTLTFTDLVDGAPDEAPGGHGDVGTGVIVGGAHNVACYTFRSLADPHKWQPTLAYGSNSVPRDPRLPDYGDIRNSPSGAHLSMLCDDETWTLYEFYGSRPDTPFSDELALIENKPNPQVKRLLHHHSIYREYNDSPRATWSRDGKFMAFTSNWGGTRRDLFIARIGASQPPPPPPPPTGDAIGTLRKVAWPTTETKQDAVIAAQWKEGYRFKRNLSGAWAEFEKIK